MKYRSACRTGLILFVMILQSLALSAKDPVWLEVSSDHFVLFTDADQTKAQRVLADLETRISALAEAFGNIPARQFPVEIFIFKTDQDFVDAAPKPQPEEKLNKSAYVLRGPDRVFIVAKDKSPEDIVND